MRFVTVPSLILSLALSSSAESGFLPNRLPLAPESLPAYGESDTGLIVVNGAAFTTLDGSTSRKVVPGLFRYYTNTTTPLVASVSVPTGVRIESWELDLCDSNADFGIFASLALVNNAGQAFMAGTDILSPAGAPGCLTVSAPSTLTVDNAFGGLMIYVFTGNALDSSLSFANARIRYRRQVSPAPATATFADVPTNHAFFKFVEAFAAAGITGGCGGGNFCPNNPVTRGQMAVFLATALGLHWPN